MNQGFLPGDTIDERKAVALVHEWFGGRMTYASMLFEGVDWAPFDIISVYLYRKVYEDRFSETCRNAE